MEVKIEEEKEGEIERREVLNMHNSFPHGFLMNVVFPRYLKYDAERRKNKKKLSYCRYNCNNSEFGG